MTAFSDLIDDLNIRQQRAKIENITEEQVAHALIARQRNFADFLALISPAASLHLEDMAQRARQITRHRFGNTILLYAPLYLSNECSNICPYCGFHAQAEIQRTVLNEAQVLAEGHYLHDQGFRHLLLVSGESPLRFTVGRLCAVIKSLSPLFPSISVEVQPLQQDQYRAIMDAGAEGVALYQETYQRGSYSQLHPRGPKSDYNFRLDAIDRAGMAGARRLGIGALLGLADFRSEAIALALHAEYLLKHYWNAYLTISVPRLRKVPAGFTIPHSVNDRDLTQLLLALRLYLPNVGLVLSTRESAGLRDDLMHLAITQMSAGSRTSPGGYLQANESGEQFEVDDRRSPKEVAQAISKAGFDPVWKDRDAVLRGGPG